MMSETVSSKVKSVGTYLNIDENGFIINPTSIEKIQEEWFPVVEAVREEYIKHFGENLHSVYIRGSVAKGEAINNISDVDSFAVVYLKHDEINISWMKAFNEEIKNKYPFVQGIEIGVVPLEDLSEHKADQIMIKTQSVCIYGDNLADSISPFQPGKSTTQHIKGIGNEIRRTRVWLQDDHTQEEVKNKCTWIMKRVLRTAFELVMERSQKYTRDLYPCYEGFSEYYPEKKNEMYRVLELAINPTTDQKVVLQILDEVDSWLNEEIQHIFHLKD